MILVWILGILFLLDALRLRVRMGHVPILPHTGRELDPDQVFLVADGVSLDEATKRAASAYARAAGLDVLDLIPGDWPISEWMSLGELCDPLASLTQPLQPGHSAAHALLVNRATLERAGDVALPLLGVSGADTATFVAAAAELRCCAPRSSGMAVAPDLLARDLEGSDRATAFGLSPGGKGRGLLLLQGAVLAFLVGTLFFAPFAGLVLAALYHLQVPLALAGQCRTRRPMWPWVLARLPLDILAWFDTVTSKGHEEGEDQVDALRAEYARLLTRGEAAFLEPRRPDCPSCASGDLEFLREHTDFYQHKPGRFRLDRCQSCGLVFQNPRLTPEGLSFYYKDFYDGLGADTLGFSFGSDTEVYDAQAQLVDGHLRERTAPRRWLDVGGGKGHFCLSARDIWPQTDFELLDMADSAVDAERRGWVTAGHQALFPQWARRVSETGSAGPYDVVSMSRYLEHTREPSKEIEAARRVLEPGGLFLIEVPDPECSFGRWLGWTWRPWFQPQHLNLLPLRRLEHLLSAAGFEVLVRHRVEANQRVDLYYALHVILSRALPEPDRPWLPRTHGMARALHGLMWLVGLPLLLVARLLDQFLIGPVAERMSISNSYRVLARLR